ncbi:MAG: hypothetical protein ACK56F_05045, partial [bacterium]
HVGKQGGSKSGGIGGSEAQISDFTDAAKFESSGGDDRLLAQTGDGLDVGTHHLGGAPGGTVRIGCDESLRGGEIQPHAP